MIELWLRIGPDGPLVRQVFADRETAETVWAHLEDGPPGAVAPERHGGLRAMIERPKTLLRIAGVEPEDLAALIMLQDVRSFLKDEDAEQTADG